MKEKWLTLTLAMALTLGLAGCGAAEKSDAPTPTGTTAVQPTTEPTSAPDPAPTPEPSPETPDGYAVGERAEQGNVAVTLTEVEESTGSSFFAPDEGKVFLICHFDIENNSDDDLAISSMLSFKAYVDDYAASLSLNAILASEDTQLDGSVAAGKKMAGVVGYEAPQDWSELEVSFTPNVWSGKSLTFIAEKE